MKRGWLVGNFEPSILKTEGFEVGVLTHKQFEDWPKHYHAIATEYNLLLQGKMALLGEIINPGDGFIIEPGEVVKAEFYEDCQILCIKVPSVIGDKYEVL